MKQPKQTRMCIKCRKRFHQKELLRLQSDGYSLCPFSGKGRSFYVCGGCLEQPNAFEIIFKIKKLKFNEVHVAYAKEIWNLWKQK
ncbi:YlxR family protein [Helicobacter marmotae]|uniref:DUF448 domain-containing protein n=1 Tax=Helicobacter marmotae TaxID=152490 RepID=A0A3D8I2R8_9HELI|nr:DUF448 domain-containing protein [Helicobacter marmotae]RDU59432.1 DUF448 domain-containing protein [Helicobacter marmotae]